MLRLGKATGKRLFLIHGKPKQGKTTLAINLQEDVISVDAVFVGCIQQYFPNLYFPDLKHFISPFYHGIITTMPRIVAQWKEYVERLVLDEVQVRSRVVVEGHLLFGVLDRLEEKASPWCEVYKIHVKRRQYFIGGQEYSLEDIRALVNEQTLPCPSGSSPNQEASPDYPETSLPESELCEQCPENDPDLPYSESETIPIEPDNHSTPLE